MIDVDAALIDAAPDPVRKAVPQVPAHRQQDHIRRRPEPGERRRSLHGRPRTTIALHPATRTDPGRSVNATEPAYLLKEGLRVAFQLPYDQAVEALGR